MYKSKFIRSCYVMRVFASEFFHRYSKWLMLYGAFAIGGIIFGVINISIELKDIKIDYLINTNMLNFFLGKASFIGFFLLSVLNSCITVAIVFFSNCYRWSCFVSFFVIFVNAYYISFDFVLIISKLGLSGIFNGLIIILPCSILLLSLLICVSAMLFDKLLCYKNINCAFHSCRQDYIKAFLIFLCVSCAINLILAITLSFSVIKFIIIV